jgi:hypothetical protein
LIWLDPAINAGRPADQGMRRDDDLTLIDEVAAG